MFRLVTDVSSVGKSVGKVRYAWYSTLAEARAQAEHEMATPAAVKRHREHFRNDDLVLHPSGVLVLRIEDKAGKTVWEPASK